MKYVIVTVEWCLNHGVVVPAQARRSVDGLKVILHEDYIDPVLREEIGAPLGHGDLCEGGSVHEEIVGHPLQGGRQLQMGERGALPQDLAVDLP